MKRFGMLTLAIIAIVGVVVGMNYGTQISQSLKGINLFKKKTGDSVVPPVKKGN